jgi:Bacterial Ig domain
MTMSKGLLVSVMVMLFAAVILGSACAAPAPPPPPPPAQAANQIPVISKLTANPPEIVAGRSTTITAIAADPDDDPITYKWSVSEGNVAGTDSQVTWTAPNNSGSFTIGLTVSDNRGGQATGSVTVTVLAPTKTVTLNPVPSETGTVNQRNATDYSKTMAGDTAQGIGMRAFWSFDISSVLGKDIRKATLKFTTGNMVGNPFAYGPAYGLGGLMLWKDTYGSTLPAYGYVGAEIPNVGLLYSPPSTVDVTPAIGVLADYGVDRYQVEALFTRSSNGDFAPNYVEWPSVVLEVTYAQ